MGKVERLRCELVDVGRKRVGIARIAKRLRAPLIAKHKNEIGMRLIFRHFADLGRGEGVRNEVFEQLASACERVLHVARSWQNGIGVAKSHTRERGRGGRIDIARKRDCRDICRASALQYAVDRLAVESLTVQLALARDDQVGAND